MRDVWSEISPHSWSGQTFKWEGYFNSPAFCIHFIINHLTYSTVFGGWEEGSVFHFIQKLREFLRLSGSLPEAVGWIQPSMEIFLGLALNKKGAQWSMSSGPADWGLQTPTPDGLQGTHTNWPTEPPSHTIPSLLSQQLPYRTTLQHH